MDTKNGTSEKVKGLPRKTQVKKAVTVFWGKGDGHEVCVSCFSKHRTSRAGAPLHAER